jgi:hypothetical protein
VDALYALSQGEGDLHNSSFIVSGSLLKAKETVPYVKDAQFSIQVTATDKANPEESISRQFLLTLRKALSTGGTDSDRALQVYPNPFSGSCILVPPPAEHDEMVLSVTDLAGRIIREEKVAAFMEHVLHQGELAPGIYLLKLRGHQEYKGKLVVMD